MKLKKRYLVFVGTVPVIVLVLIGITFLLGILINIDSATTGINYDYLKTAGMAIACGLRESNAFPRDGGPDDKDHQAEQPNQWYATFDVDELLLESGMKIDKDIPIDYFDTEVWTVVKNIPDDPPSNLIVLATRNVDTSSLRTKLTDEDMQKHIRFKEKKDDLWILNQAAVLIRSDGTATAVPVVPPTSRRKNTATYRYIYRSQPFDLTANSVNGLQVKYLTPDGEVIPTND